MKRALVALAVIGLALLFWSLWDRELVMEWIARARPLPFFAAMAILPAFGAPLTPFFVLAGATFGNIVGLVGSLLALGLNLALCYGIARSSLRPRLASLLRRFGHELPDFGQAGKSAFRFTLAVKLAPGLPGFVKNYGLGVAGVAFPLYFIASMAITGLYAASFVILGESLLAHDLSRLLLVGGAFVVLFAVIWWIRRRMGGMPTASPA